MTLNAHGCVTPVSASRHLSKSTPTYPACFVKTKPIFPVGCPFVLHTLSNVFHVSGAVELAFRPLVCLGTFVGPFLRCSIRQLTHWWSRRSSSGMFPNWISAVMPARPACRLSYPKESTKLRPCSRGRGQCTTRDCPARR